ncbi:hypothetical protein LXA43DRAFT_1097296 [Ganoderma leucocontextum]|nr:hypothetical protein LXA43DRAFT_1097296 [Ganoderma leucocontextum]
MPERIALTPLAWSRSDASYSEIDHIRRCWAEKLTTNANRKVLMALSNVNTLTSGPPGTHLAGANSEPSEGGFTYKPENSEYYFLFFSNGITPTTNTTQPRPAPGKEYKVLVGRSKSVSGPFLDKSGKVLTEAADPPTGTLVLGSHDNIYAPGGQSVYLDPVSGRDVIVYHYVPNDAYGGPSYLGINYLTSHRGGLLLKH